MIFHSKQNRLIAFSALSILCIIIICVAIVIFQDEIVSYLMPTTGWVQFNVPTDARQLRASVKRAGAGFNICNEDAVDWSDITVKVTGIYNTPYLARPKPIKTGACELVPFSDFAEPSWKRMQMPPNQTLVKVELLVKHQAGGYMSLPLNEKTN